MPVDEGRAGRGGCRVVMHAGPLDVRPVALRRGVVYGEGQPRGLLEQRPDYLGQQASGDAIGPFDGGGDGGGAGAKHGSEVRGPEPGGYVATPSGQDGAEEQEGNPGCGAAIEGGREPGEPLAGDGRRVRRCHRGPAPLGVSGSVLTAMV